MELRDIYHFADLDEITELNEKLARKHDLATQIQAQAEDFARLIAEGSFPLASQFTPGRFHLIPFAAAALDRLGRIVNESADNQNV